MSGKPSPGLAALQVPFSTLTHTRNDVNGPSSKRPTPGTRQQPRPPPQRFGSALEHCQAANQMVLL